MFISKINLNPHSRQVQSELKDPYQMHRTISKAFADDSADFKDARVLFRVDEDHESRLSILVQSMYLPDWSHLPYDNRYTEENVMVKELKPFFNKGNIFQFRLKANPTIKKDCKRLGLYKEDDQLKWLSRKADVCGFEILSVSVKPAEQISSSTSKDKGLFAIGQFDGVLKITDPDMFRKTLESGIGSAKGFGFGLLSIAPIR